MTLAQLFMPISDSSVAYECVNALGELGLVEFTDLNDDDHQSEAHSKAERAGTNSAIPSFQRKYTKEVRRTDEMMRKLRFFETEIVKNSIMIEGPGSAINDQAPDMNEMQSMEQEFENQERAIKDINQNADKLDRQEAELTEMKHIL